MRAEIDDEIIEEFRRRRRAQRRRPAAINLEQQPRTIAPAPSALDRYGRG